MVKNPCLDFAVFAPLCGWKISCGLRFSRFLPVFMLFAFFHLHFISARHERLKLRANIQHPTSNPAKRDRTSNEWFKYFAFLCSLRFNSAKHFAIDGWWDESSQLTFGNIYYATISKKQANRAFKSDSSTCHRAMPGGKLFGVFGHGWKMEKRLYQESIARRHRF